ncbi:MAG: SIS domain-containing protein, partial [Mycobacterium sp.]
MTVQELWSDDCVLTYPEMAKLVTDAMTTTRANIDSLCADPRFARSVVNAAIVLIESLRAGNRVLACGNGGSLCDAMHFAEELTGNFRSHRMPLGALALSDSAHLT